jgi:predicted small integral membrane protein
MTIGGEWFEMRQSSTWNGVPSAFRFHITILALLIYLSLSELLKSHRLTTAIPVVDRL